MQVVCDACGSGNPIAEEMAWRRMERAGVGLTSTNAVIAELVREGVALILITRPAPPSGAAAV